MPHHRLNTAAVRQARQLVGDGKVDSETSWSDGAPSTHEANEVIERRGYDGYGAWHLGIDEDASDDTKGRYAFSYGDFTKVSRAAVIHAKQRAAQNDHRPISDAADDLLQRIDQRHD